ncbi:hypothetical protein C8R46DRAFT_1205850 [Mycena filopes]|nr:hypothetical protein C8R46DRAFT_1205850 [Mycena filopes]
MNGLTTQAGLKIGPIVLETLVKHYFGDILRLKAHKTDNTQLRREELLYDEAFNIVKAFLNAASYHTVEEVQAFANTRTPSPPWVHVVRLVVPMSCCDEAARYLITALGGEDAARKVVGGCKWWQVRGVSGVDAQWITARKDWREAKRRYKSHKSKTPGEAPVDPAADSAPYEEYMDELRCILYAHGGGYYFGSVDQERYSIQRHARKINGRVFAINYRLAPQYPFPCALQDLVAAYLYLIRPPPGASHRPVNPAHLVVAGDSAGGGLTLALLQVLRDTGLPLPAGGVLISPWCDLTHSFPSIHTNTATDVIPEYGLSFQKPSSLWPPPSDDMSRKVHASLRTWIRNTFKDHPRPPTPPPGPALASVSSVTLPVPEAPVPESSAPKPPLSDTEAIDVGATAPVPHDTEVITLTAKSGEELRIDKQIHLYTKNSLLVHPLISGAGSYLGGLPPLLIIASDKEVLRDEIIYTAHRAANPQKFPLKDDVRAMYPPLDGIEEKYGPTKVHLQVYDDTAHVLPVLFSFTTPGKFCYRAIATFCRDVTGMKQLPPRHDSTPTPRREKFDLSTPTPRREKFDLSALPPLPPSPFPSSADISNTDTTSDTLPALSASTLQVPKVSGLRRASSVLSPKRLSVFRSTTLPPIKTGTPTSSSDPGGLPNATTASPAPNGSYFSYFGPSRLSATPGSIPSSNDASTSSDVGGPRFPHSGVSTPMALDGERTAGDPVVYTAAEWTEGTIMVRERVSTRGVLRPLEPEADLIAFSVPPEAIGVVSELAVRRFLDGTQRWDRKFAGAYKTVEKHRQRNLERARKDTVRNMNVLQHFITREADAKGKHEEKKTETVMGIKDGLLASSGSWSWAWALDANENPPPSSIVSRRDTQEALRLARIADQPMLQSEEHSMTGNNLWSVMVNFLTVAPDKDKSKSEDSTFGVPEKATPLRKRKSTISRIFPSKEKGKDKDKGTV